jgi:ABC-type transport system involved in multi-copper enzyme maturation permease subunit
MIVLPIVDRELRVAARRAATYRTRLWAALAAILLAAWKCLGFSWQGLAAASQGQALFNTLSGLAFVYCLGIGARVTSDCVSEEKREGTLGLLFLTDLKGIDVVFGKLVASSLNSFYGLLAVVPLLAMPLLLGGVTLLQFGKMVLVLLNALFFSLSAGLLVSALSRNERKAMLGTILAVLSPAFVPVVIFFLLAMARGTFQELSDLLEWFPLLMASPVYPFLLSNPGPLGPVLSMLAIPAWSFWTSLATVHVLSWMMLFLAAEFLPVIWRDRPKTAPAPATSSVVAGWLAWSCGHLQERQALRLRLIERNPYLWLVSRDCLKPAYAWFFVFSMIAVWLWGYWQHREVMFDFYPLVPTVILVHCFLKIWVVSEVSHRLVEDQRNGALEVLLSTPLTLAQIMAGQRMALVRQFGPPVLVLGALEVLAFRSTYPVEIILPVLLMLVADLFTLMWVGMRLSLTARSINEVLLKSCLGVLFLPWITFLVAWPLFEPAWRHFALADPQATFTLRVYLWFIIGILIDAILLLGWARPELLTPLRPRGLRRWNGARPRFQKPLTPRLKTPA